MAPRTYPGPPEFADLPLCAGEEPDLPRPPIVLAPPPAPCPEPGDPERVRHAADRSTLRLEQAPPDPILKNEKGGYVFSRYGAAPGGVPDRETPVFDKSALFLSSPLSEIPVNWYIELWAYERARIVAAGSPVPPLGQGDLGETPGFMSRLKVAIVGHRSSGGVIKILDLAEGIRLSMAAERVSAHILFPAPGYFGLGEIADSTRLDGYVLDTMIGGFMCQAFAPPGKQLGTNTFTVRVPAGAADVRHDVPPGARGLTLWQSPEGAVATPEWRLLRGSDTPPIPGPSLGTITIGATRRAQLLDRPGNAGMITTGPADSVDRFLTFVWNLEI